MADVGNGVGFDFVMGGGSHNRADGRLWDPPPHHEIES